MMLKALKNEKVPPNSLIIDLTNGLGQFTANPAVRQKYKLFAVDKYKNRSLQPEVFPGVYSYDTIPTQGRMSSAQIALLSPLTVPNPACIRGWVSHRPGGVRHFRVITPHSFLKICCRIFFTKPFLFSPEDIGLVNKSAMLSCVEIHAVTHSPRATPSRMRWYAIAAHFFFSVDPGFMVLASTDLLSPKIKAASSTGIPIIRNLYRNERTYSAASFIAVNSAPRLRWST